MMLPIWLDLVRIHVPLLVLVRGSRLPLLVEVVIISELIDSESEVVVESERLGVVIVLRIRIWLPLGEWWMAAGEPTASPPSPQSREDLDVEVDVYGHLALPVSVVIITGVLIATQGFDPPY